MGKQGPCYHCGITYTPLWRNGPPEKPVLCNACGSRWRTKGTLANYTPLHARAFEATDSSDYKCGHGKKGLQNPKQQRSNKRKEPGEDDEFGILESDPQYAIGVDEDASNRSSSGSGISYSEGCMQYGGTVGMDNSGSVYPPVWDSPIPQKSVLACIARDYLQLKNLRKACGIFCVNKIHLTYQGPQRICFLPAKLQWFLLR